jgi:hypothetical protein
VQKQKKYLTPEGNEVLATFYRAHVFWYYTNRQTVGNIFNKNNDPTETFFNRVANGNWKEIE